MISSPSPVSSWETLWQNRSTLENCGEMCDNAHSVKSACSNTLTQRVMWYPMFVHYECEVTKLAARFKVIND